MKPVSQCLRKVDHASATADQSAASRIIEALDELERAYRRPSERIVALEAVLHEFDRGSRADAPSISRLLRLSVERRQNKWSRHT